VPEFLLHSSHYGDTSGFEITSDVQAALLEAKHAFICSGTATLEAALIGTPLTLAYIANNFDYKLARALAHVEHTGLANIIIEKAYGHMMHSEFFQEAVTAQNLYDDYLKTDVKKFQNDAVHLKTLLKHGSSQEVAKLL
jgi:lipid-A-disaccharide synthase